jgi:hypothetical protein
MIPTLGHVDTVHMLPSYFFKILFNITPLMPKSLKLSLSYQNLLCISLVHHVCCISSLYNSIQNPITFSSLDSN